MTSGGAEGHEKCAAGILTLHDRQLQLCHLPLGDVVFLYPDRLYLTKLCICAWHRALATLGVCVGSMIVQRMDRTVVSMKMVMT